LDGGSDWHTILIRGTAALSLPTVLTALSLPFSQKRAWLVFEATTPRCFRINWQSGKWELSKLLHKQRSMCIEIHGLIAAEAAC
jgi:hypothetical protein